MVQEPDGFGLRTAQNRVFDAESPACLVRAGRSPVAVPPKGEEAVEKRAPASVPPQHRRHGVLHAGDAVGPLQAALSPIGMVKSRDLIG
jgi:hypothetical protein